MPDNAIVTQVRRRKLDPGFESTRFQSLIAKRIHIAFNSNPCFELAPLHYTQVRAMLANQAGDLRAARRLFKVRRCRLNTSG